MIYYRYRTIELHYHNDVVEYYEWRRVLFMKNIAKKFKDISSRKKCMFLCISIVALIGVVILNGSVSYAEDTYSIYGVIRKSAEENEVSYTNSKGSLSDTSYNNETKTTTVKSDDDSEDEPYKGPKHNGKGQNVVLSAASAGDNTKKTDTSDENKVSSEDGGDKNKRKNKSESNIISKLDNIDTSDLFSNDTIEGTSDEYNNYEIVRGTMPTFSEIMKSNITKEYFYQGAVAIGQRADSNYNLRSIIDKDIVKDSFYTSFSSNKKSRKSASSTVYEPGFVSTGSAINIDEENTGLNSEMTTDADATVASAGAIMFTNKNELQINLNNNNQVYAQYADKILFNTDEMYGDIVLKEEAQAEGDVILASRRILVDTSKPVIGVFTENKTSYDIKISENGDIISGLKSVECYIDGKKIDISENNVTKEVCLGYNVKVPVEYVVSLTPSEGKHTLYVKAQDNCGNVTEEKTDIIVEKQMPLSVLTLKKFVIHIDPQKLKWKDQIYSDAVVMKNLNDYDIKATVSDINIEVSRENDKYRKCKIYMVMPDTGKKVLLKNGNNTGSYSFTIPHGDKIKQNYLRFVGKIYDDKYGMWKNEDISINMKTSYERIE